MTDEADPPPPAPAGEPQARSTMSRVDLLFRIYMVVLFLATLAGIYTTFFVAEAFWARVGVFLGWGSAVYLAFMGGVFWFAAWANEVGRKKAREPE